MCFLTFPKGHKLCSMIRQRQQLLVLLCLPCGKFTGVVSWPHSSGCRYSPKSGNMHARGLPAPVHWSPADGLSRGLDFGTRFRPGATSDLGFALTHILI